MLFKELFTEWGKKTREVVDRRLMPIAAEIDRNGVYDPRNLDILIEEGLIAPNIPKAYGGSGLTEFEFSEVMREISRASTSAASMTTCNLMAAYGLLAGASEEQKMEILPKMVTGEMIGTPAITEPGAGSDAGAMITRAECKGDHYVINGEKALVSWLGRANYYLTFAKTNPEAGNRGITAFIVRDGNPGMTYGTPLNKMGQRGLATGKVFYNECKVPLADRVGEEGQGMHIMMELLNRSRLIVGFQSIGTAVSAYDAALAYAQKRVAFGKPIIAQQSIAFKLADMAIKLQTAQTVVNYAAQKVDSGTKDYVFDVSVAKVYCAEISREICSEAIQIHGGMGYTDEHPVERLYRDQRVFEIYGGTSEIARLVISRILSGASKVK